MKNLLKSRDITLPAKVCIVKAMVFPEVMSGCERWTIKKVEHQRIYAFELWCWTRLLRVPWTARRSKESILKEISPEYSLAGCNLHYFGQLIGRTDLFKRPQCWERLKAGGKGEDRRWNCWVKSSTGWTWVWASSGSWWWTGKPAMLHPMI